MTSNTRKSQRYSLNKNKYLLPPEREKLDWLLESHIQQEPRNCALLKLALNTGARATELLNLTTKDLNTYDKTIFIRGIKGSNDREIPLRDELFFCLQTLTPQPQSGKLFPFSYNRLRQIWEFYRPTHKTFHSLRHTFAIQLYQKTRDIRLVQVALGHRNITNTMIYADYVYSQQELRRLIL
jgi:integrase/recombinase XerC